MLKSFIREINTVMRLVKIKTSSNVDSSSSKIKYEFNFKYLIQNDPTQCNSQNHPSSF